MTYCTNLNDHGFPSCSLIHTAISFVSPWIFWDKFVYFVHLSCIYIYIFLIPQNFVIRVLSIHLYRILYYSFFFKSICVKFNISLVVKELILNVVSFQCMLYKSMSFNNVMDHCIVTHDKRLNWTKKHSHTEARKSEHRWRYNYHRGRQSI